MQRLVLKIGGSLFDDPALPERLDEFVRFFAPASCFLIPGGGPVADCVREWDRLHAIGEEQAHWMALQSLDVTAELLQVFLPESEPCRSFSDVQQRSASMGMSIVHPRGVLESLEQSSLSERRLLPHNWDVTSDSIAAYLASCCDAELVLAKSVNIPSVRIEDRMELLNVEEAAQAGLVDRYFPVVSRHVSRVAWCNIRVDPVEVQTWFTNSIPLP